MVLMLTNNDEVDLVKVSLLVSLTVGRAVLLNKMKEVSRVVQNSYICAFDEFQT